MTNRLAWTAVGLSVATVLAHAVLVLRPPASGLATLPIFVPASLEVESVQRAARGQSAGRGGLEAADLAQALLEERFSTETAAALEEPLAAVRGARVALLDARNRRHALNVSLMRAGVDLGRELTPAQWEHVISSRDAVKATEEAALFGELEAALAR